MTLSRSPWPACSSLSKGGCHQVQMGHASCRVLIERPCQLYLTRIPKRRTPRNSHAHILTLAQDLYTGQGLPRAGSQDRRHEYDISCLFADPENGPCDRWADALSKPRSPVRPSQADAGQLVALFAARPLLQLVCHGATMCGKVPNALLMTPIWEPCCARRGAPRCGIRS
jgi:hypothetical protein